MIVTVGRTLRINMGPYEYVETRAEVTIDTSELADGEDPVALAGEVLDDLLADDIRRAADTAPSDSFINDWKE